MNKNYELMQYFFDMLKEFIISNPDYEINSNFVYSNLIRFNIRKDQHPDVDISNYFNYFKAIYSNNSSIETFQPQKNKYFLWFMNGKLKGNEIKLYIPMDYNHIEEGGKQLFDFIASTGIEHQSKIASIIRNDDVVIRVNSLEDANKILDFISNNKYIQEGLIKTNPFIPNFNGVGMVMDNNFSFNRETSQIISDFVEKLKKEDRLDLINVDQFNQYITSIIPTINALDKRDIYNLLSKTTSKNFNIKDFYDYANDKLLDKYTENRERIIDPEYYLELAIVTTEKKYPGNSKEAIYQYLSSNPNYFSNDNRVRESLKKHLKPGDLIPIMRNKLIKNSIPIPNSDRELIENYFNVCRGYKEKFEIIKNAYLCTLSKYNSDQARVAFENLYLNNEIKYFTNDNNFRSLLSQQVIISDVKKIVLSNIDINNIDIDDIDEIFNRFKETIIYDKTKSNTLGDY